MERTIKVTGTGIYKVVPNMQTIVFCCEIYKNTYEECLRYYNEKNKEFYNNFAKIGIDEKDIFTTDFNIYANYEYYTEKTFNKTSNKTKLINYKFTLEYRIITEKNIKTLGKILRCFNDIFSKDKKIELRVNIQYSYNDNEKAKKEAIMLAVKNCTERAILLAKSSNVELGDVLNIDYSWNNITVSSPFRRDNTILLGEEDTFGGFEFNKEMNVIEIEYKAEVNTIYEIK